MAFFPDSPIIASTLGNVRATGAGSYAPTLSITTGMAGGTWLTICTDVSDGSAVTVTNSTSVTPSFAYPAANGAYITTHQYTGLTGRKALLSYTVHQEGAGGALVTLAADPADQVKGAGTTSSTAATFATPTGGSGAFTAAVTIEQVRGTGATKSGSGAGPITINNLEDDDIVHSLRRERSGFRRARRRCADDRGDRAGGWRGSGLLHHHRRERDDLRDRQRRGRTGVHQQLGHSSQLLP